MPRMPQCDAARPDRSRSGSVAARLQRIFALVLALAVLSSVPGPLARLRGDASGSEEYRVKAAFLYNFIKYTSWPDEAFDEPDSPIVVSIVGSDPFGEVLDATLRGKQVSGRALAIARIASVPDEVDAHIAFTDSASAVGKEFVRRASQKPVLVVDDRGGIVESGAQVGFYLVSGHVRFEVNLAKVKEAHLTISSELLKLARIVGDGKETRS